MCDRAAKAEVAYTKDPLLEACCAYAESLRRAAAMLRRDAKMFLDTQEARDVFNARQATPEPSKSEGGTE